MAFDSGHGWASLMRSLFNGRTAFEADLLIFFAFGVAAYLFQALFVVRRFKLRALIESCFPADYWLSKASLVDLFLHLLNGALGRLTKGIVLASAVVFTASLDGAQPVAPPPPVSIFEIVGFAVIGFMFYDFGEFLGHYFQHKSALFWELHKVHHSAVKMSIFSENRQHPIDQMLQRLLPYLALAVPMSVGHHWWRFGFAEMFLWVAITRIIMRIAVLDILRHSHMSASFGWLNAILISPIVHQLHHSTNPLHYNKNMGDKLLIWDWMFGTAMLPKPGERFEFGLDSMEETLVYHDFRGAIVTPLVRIYSRFLRPQRTRTPAVAPPAVSGSLPTNGTLQPIQGMNSPVEIRL